MARPHIAHQLVLGGDDVHLGDSPCRPAVLEEIDGTLYNIGLSYGVFNLQENAKGHPDLNRMGVPLSVDFANTSYLKEVARKSLEHLLLFV